MSTCELGDGGGEEQEDGYLEVREAGHGHDPRLNALDRERGGGQSIAVSDRQNDPVSSLRLNDSKYTKTTRRPTSDCLKTP